jgi:hypothetical protein
MKYENKKRLSAAYEDWSRKVKVFFLGQGASISAPTMDSRLHGNDKKRAGMTVRVEVGEGGRE